jgi:hypothetical protein
VRRLADVQLPHRRLDADTLTLLTEGDRTGRYRSGSELAMSLAVRFRNAGRSLDDYLDAMTDASNAASAWYRHLRDGRRGRNRKTARGRDRAIRELERCWHKAGRLPAPRRSETADVYERATALRDRAWNVLEGRTRPTRLRVLDAVLDLAVHHRTVRPMCSVRDVAARAACPEQPPPPRSATSPNTT